MGESESRINQTDKSDRINQIEMERKKDGVPIFGYWSFRQ